MRSLLSQQASYEQFGRRPTLISDLDLVLENETTVGEVSASRGSWRYQERMTPGVYLLLLLFMAVLGERPC